MTGRIRYGSGRLFADIDRALTREMPPGAVAAARADVATRHDVSIASEVGS